MSSKLYMKGRRKGRGDHTGDIYAFSMDVANVLTDAIVILYLMCQIIAVPSWAGHVQYIVICYSAFRSLRTETWTSSSADTTAGLRVRVYENSFFPDDPRQIKFSCAFKRAPVWSDYRYTVIHRSFGHRKWFRVAFYFLSMNSQIYVHVFIIYIQRCCVPILKVICGLWREIEEIFWKLGWSGLTDHLDTLHNIR